MIPDGSGTGGMTDGGVVVFPVPDASDGRDIPVDCQSAADCDDGDPCTADTCEDGACGFAMAEIKLDPIYVRTLRGARDIALVARRMYVAEGDAGVEAFNIAVPGSPVSIGRIETEGNALAVDANDAGVVVSEGEDGIELFASSDMSWLARVKAGRESLRGVDQVLDVELGKPYSIAAAYSDGVVVLDLSNLRNPVAVAELNTNGRALSSAAGEGCCGFIADSLTGAVSVDFGAEQGPQLSGKVMSEGRVVDVALSSETGLMAEYGNGFGIVDFSDPQHPERLVRVASSSPSVSVSLLGPQTAVVALNSGTVRVYDLTDPFLPVLVSSWKGKAAVQDVESLSGIIAVALGTEGVVLFETGCVP